MQQGIEQHGSVSIGKHEAVAVRPDRIFRVIAQKLLPQTVGDRSESHRRTGMARVRLLYRVHRKSANRIDTQLIELCTGGDRLVTDSHQFSPRKISWRCRTHKLDEISAQWIQLRNCLKFTSVSRIKTRHERTKFEFYTEEEFGWGIWRRIETRLAASPAAGDGASPVSTGE